MMKYISSLKDKENKLSEAKEELERLLSFFSSLNIPIVFIKVASAEENDVYDGGGSHNNLANNQINSPQLTTHLDLYFGKSKEPIN